MDAGDLGLEICSCQNNALVMQPSPLPWHQQCPELHALTSAASSCSAICSLLTFQSNPLQCKLRVRRCDIECMDAGHIECCQENTTLLIKSIPTFYVRRVQSGTVHACLVLSPPQRCRGRRLRPCRWCACPGRRTHCPTATCLHCTAPTH